MDKQTLSNYGWVVTVILVLAIMISLATPFASVMKANIQGVVGGFQEIGENAFDQSAPDNFEDLINPDTTVYIKLSSEEDIYALSRLLQLDSIKTGFIGKDTSYDINDDFDRFEYPEEVTTDEEKIAYLQTSAYKLTNDVELTLQKVANKNYFTGIGSTNFPFKGTFNGNGKTITLTAAGDLNLNDVSDFGTGLFDTTENAKIFNVRLDVKSDVIITAAKESVQLGLVAGKARYTEFEKCTVNITNAVVGTNYSASHTIPTSIGGIAAESAFSVYKECKVVLNNATLSGQGTSVTPSRKYGAVAVGGILGFSGAGSDNDSNIGRLGNQLYDCDVVSRNASQQDVLVACVESGNEVAVGGVVGCTFNNLVVKNCSVDIQKGNISAMKTGSSDSAEFGAQAGGVVGRLEHTGEISGCSVVGDYLTILAKSPNNISNAGGVVGVDMGPYHRDIDSINNCSFDGSGTSNIRLEITAMTGTAKILSAGGIVGTGSYIISDCSVKNVTITNNSECVTNPSAFIGEVCGYKSPASDTLDAKGKTNTWKYGTYFTPRTPEIVNCTVENVTLTQTDNVQNLAYAN